MEVYESGSVVEATVSFDVDSIQSAVYRVLDERRVELVAQTPIVIPGGASEIAITVPALKNTLAVGASRMLVSVELTITTNTGAIRKFRTSYLVQGDTALVVPLESFLSFDEAIMIAGDLTGIAGWTAANDAQKRAALMQAATNIDQLEFDLTSASEFTDFPGFSDYDVETLSTLTSVEFEALPDAFLTAIKRAQVYEADDLLGGSPIQKAREEGLLSHTVGESSQMFRSASPHRGYVCGKAMKVLRRFVQTSRILRRA